MAGRLPVLCWFDLLEGAYNKTNKEYAMGPMGGFGGFGGFGIFGIAGLVIGIIALVRVFNLKREFEILKDAVKELKEK